MAAIETEALTKYYGASRGIEDLDRAVEEGDVFGFLGPNGAGKTTTIRLLLGLIHPTRGAARLLGTPVDGTSANLRTHVGYLPGEVGLPAHLTGREFLARFARLRGGGFGPKAEALAQRLDLDLSVRTKHLSHGTRQKLAIVQAFMHDVRLLILDEPTTGLDPLAQQTFYEIVEEERGRNRTVFLSSHVLNEVERTCVRVGIIREGRLVAVENVEDLKQRRVKWAEAEFDEEVDADALRVPGVQSVQVEGRRVRMAITGNYADVLRALSAHAIDNVSIRDATLEEIFLEYYTGPRKEDR